jgi:hypothetical protein
MSNREVELAALLSQAKRDAVRSMRERGVGSYLNPAPTEDPAHTPEWMVKSRERMNNDLDAALEQLVSEPIDRAYTEAKRVCEGFEQQVELFKNVNLDIQRSFARQFGKNPELNAGVVSLLKSLDDTRDCVHSELERNRDMMVVNLLLASGMSSDTAKHIAYILIGSK